MTNNIPKHIENTYRVFSKNNRETPLKALETYYTDPKGSFKHQLIWTISFALPCRLSEAVGEANEVVAKVLDQYNVINPIAPPEEEIDIDIDDETINSIINSNPPKKNTSSPVYVFRRVNRKYGW